jgi:REP element-mobilizing transposase RayT
MSTLGLVVRPLRLEIPGGLYHITARKRTTLDRPAIFFEIVEQVVDRFGIVIHAARLMDNHHHLLVETPPPNLARAMRQLNGVYAQTYNRRHKQTAGHLRVHYATVSRQLRALEQHAA